MSLPKKLTIGGVDYQLSLEPDGVKDYYLGCIKYSDGIIRILKTQCYDQQVATLLHELGHAICESYALDLGDSEERIVQSMANGYHQALKPYLTFAKEKKG